LSNDNLADDLQSSSASAAVTAPAARSFRELAADPENIIVPSLGERS
jgi:hypothetical protein